MIPKFFMGLVLMMLAAMAFSHIDFNEGKLAAIAPAAGPVKTLVQKDYVPPIGGAFSLVDDSGKAVTERDLVGDKYHLIFFGFSNCAEACPAMLSTMAWVFDNLPETARAKLQMVFVSIDPVRDNAAKLRAFVDGFNPAFVGWLGTQEETARMAKAYLATAVIPTDAKADDPSWQASHSTLLYLMGPDGRYVTHMRNSDSATSIRDRLVELVK